MSSNSIKSIVHNSDILRMKRAYKALYRLLLFVLIPTMIAAIYHLFFASQLYESEAKFTVYIGAMEASHHDLTAQTYLQSREAFKRLNDEFQVIESYKSRKLDYFKRLRADASFEEAYQHYLQLLKLSFDPISGVSTLKIRATTGHKAKVYAVALLKYANEAINRVTQSLKSDQLNFAKQEIRTAETRVAVSRSMLVQLHKISEYSAEKSSNMLNLKMQLEQELSKTRAQYNQLKGIMTPNSPQLIVLNDKINYLLSMIEEQNKIAIEENTGNAQSKESLIREHAFAEKAFAEDTYFSALKFLEAVRNDLLKQYHYLVVIVPPNLPETTDNNEKYYDILKTFAVLLSLYAIISLLLASIKEHMRI